MDQDSGEIVRKDYSASAEPADELPLLAPPAWEAWLAQHKAALTHELAEEFGAGMGMARAADRKHCEHLIGKLDRRMAKLEGKIDAMMSVLALTKDRLGNLKGEKGERGERGLTGRKGHDGKNAPVWSDVAFDPQLLALVAKMSDGSVGPILARVSVRWHRDRSRDLFDSHQDARRQRAPIQRARPVPAV